MARKDVQYPYSPLPNSLKGLLQKIPTIGIPEKATQEWLASIGYSGGNNKRNLAVIRQVGIIDGSGRPTPLWHALRAKDRRTFAAGIRKHYANLYATYPDAHRKDDEALIAFVRSKTDYAEQAQRLAVRTFRVLTEFGDFDQPSGELPHEDEPESQNGDERQDRGDSDVGGAKHRVVREATGVGLTVNIQLQLPPSADGEVYDKLFAAMAKHLKGLVTLE